MKTHRQYGRAWALAAALSAVFVTGAGTTQAAQEEVRVKTQRPADATAPMARRQGAETRSVTVRFDDLALQRPAGAKTLYARLRTAARNVCAPAAPRELAAHRDWNQCYSEALDQAVAATESSQVSALHLARTGRGLAADVALRN